MRWVMDRCMSRRILHFCALLDCEQVARISPSIKQRLRNNIILLEKENAFIHMGECIKMGHLGSELLDMARWGVSHF
jgi:hypothetical protein